MTNYILNSDHKVVPEPDLMKWAKWFEHNPNRVVEQTKVGKVRVSTVFLGLDHSFGRGGPPIVFETMIFGGPHDQYQARYRTWDEARRGHAEALKLVRGK